jgi:hypothetical protein
LLQGVEYTEAGFTISDSVFGSAFYASTGLHGLNLEAPTKFIIKTVKVKKIHSPKRSLNSSCTTKNQNDLLEDNYFPNKDKLLINLKDKQYYLDKSFLEWLAGFVDGEGNFNISLRNFKDNKYNSLILTFQIGLHIDDLPLLHFIKNKLQCGHISISGNRCNYFVNDRIGLIHVILPIFNYVKLNSSKYFHYLIFKKAVNLIINKKHLSSEGKLEIIKYNYEIKNPTKSGPLYNRNDISISDNWLAGFVDGEGCFSASTEGALFKLENHIKELELFKKIKEYLNYRSATGNLNIVLQRKTRVNSNPMVTLLFNNIRDLKNVIVPLFSKTDCIFKPTSGLQSKKIKDFNDWCIVVNIYFHGYHRLPDGILLINEIKSRWNNFRLSTNKSKAKNEMENAILPFTRSACQSQKLNYLFSLPAPYEIKNGLRFLRDTDILVSEKLKILSIDNFNNKSIFSSMSECSKTLQISRSKLKKCLLTGETYKNYKFILYS